MKTLIAITLALCVTSAYSRDNHHHRGDWVGPVIGGLVIGAAIARAHNPPPVVIHQPPVVTYTPPPVVYYPNAPVGTMVIINGRGYVSYPCSHTTVDAITGEVIVRQSICLK